MVYFGIYTPLFILIEEIFMNSLKPHFKVRFFLVVLSAPIKKSGLHIQVNFSILI